MIMNAQLCRKKNKMSTTNMNNWKLIDGVFQKEDAADVINSIVLEKIKFHKRKNFSNLIRYGKEHEFSIERQTALKIMLDEVMNALSEIPDDAEIKINANLSISVVNQITSK